MRIALIDIVTQKNIFHNAVVPYPISLLKIGAWRRSLGDEVELFLSQVPPDEFDKFWVTTVFTYDMPAVAKIIYNLRPRKKRILVGGIAATLFPGYFERLGVEVHKGLIPEAEEIPPDHSILPEKPDYSISHTSRGCLRKCGFCMVSKLEPEFIDRLAWPQDILEGTERILFYDNNWLAKPITKLRRDVKNISRFTKAGIKSVDFNQGLDCRLIDEERAELLASIPIYPIRFAFDNKAEDAYLQRAINKLADLGKKSFSYYALYNFKDSPGDFYYRIREASVLREKCGVEIAVFPMKYQPIDELSMQKDHIGPKWNRHELFGFKSLLNEHSVHGQISTKGCSVFSPLQEFEFWFGKNEAEFIRLINYPGIRKIANSRKQKLRLARLQKRAAVETQTVEASL